MFCQCHLWRTCNKCFPVAVYSWHSSAVATKLCYLCWKLSMMETMYAVYNSFSKWYIGLTRRSSTLRQFSLTLKLSQIHTIKWTFLSRSGFFCLVCFLDCSHLGVPSISVRLKSSDNALFFLTNLQSLGMTDTTTFAGNAGENIPLKRR